MTFDDFFVSVSSHGKATLNCSYGRDSRGHPCDWWYWWDTFPSIRTMRREAMEHLATSHLETPRGNGAVEVVTLFGTDSHG